MSKHCYYSYNKAHRDSCRFHTSDPHLNVTFANQGDQGDDGTQQGTVHRRVRRLVGISSHMFQLARSKQS